MTRIRGKFAPMMEELAEDPRWLMECNDLEKFLYMLILFTIYTTNGTAPDDPSYYRVRYNLVHRKHTLSTALAHIKERFPKLLCTNKKLSLLNSTIYKNRVDPIVPREEEVDIDIYSELNKKAVVEQPKKRFSAPSLEEVVSFFATMGRTDGAVFFDHFTSNGWKVGGKTLMKDWHAAARNWDRRSPVRKDEPVTRRATKLQGIPSNPNRIGLAEICPTNSQSSFVNQ